MINTIHPNESKEVSRSESVIGHGMLASAFDPVQISRLGAIVFASGVSDSNEFRAEAFSREQALLEEHLECSAQKKFVYFSTCSISDPDRERSPYALHKLQMEALVARHPTYIILRLPQVVGVTRNPYTLSNFLAERIRSGNRFPLWMNARRCLIDVMDVASVTVALLGQDTAHGILADLAPPETIRMSCLVAIMEELLGRKANAQPIERGNGASPDPSLMLRFAASLNLDLSPGYSQRTLEKYYGKRNAM